RLADPGCSRRQMCPVVGGSACDNAVVIFGKSLGFFKALFSAGRTAIPIRELRIVAIVSGDDGLRLHGHLMHGPISKVDQLFGMAQRIASASAFVSRVGCGRSVTPPQRTGERGIRFILRPPATSVGF